MILFKGRVKTICADITTLDCDAVVNAANSSLYGGGGVDGAIHRAAGPSLLMECRKIREQEYPDGLPPGRAVITDAGNMKCSRIIHTVGPIWKGGKQGEEPTLASCYKESLILADREKLSRTAFPAISTGVYGYPPQKAAEIVYETLLKLLPKLDYPREVLLVFFSQKGENLFMETLEKKYGILR